MNLDSIPRICSYQISDFASVDKITILCRGQSIEYISRYNDFNECYVVGQFDKTLLALEKYFRNKNIVQIINKCTIQTNRKICKKFNIKDIQCNFTGFLNRPVSPGRQHIYKNVIKKNPWAKIHLAPPGTREIRPKDKNGYIRWQTTGLYAVDLSVFWKPKKIWIFGLDFYTSPYYKQEKVNASMKKNKSRWKAMLYNFIKIVDHNPDISFTLFTKCKKVVSNNRNLIVKYK